MIFNYDADQVSNRMTLSMTYWISVSNLSLLHFPVCIIRKFKGLNWWVQFSQFVQVLTVIKNSFFQYFFLKDSISLINFIIPHEGLSQSKQFKSINEIEIFSLHSLFVPIRCITCSKRVKNLLVDVNINVLVVDIQIELWISTQTKLKQMIVRSNIFFMQRSLFSLLSMVFPVYTLFNVYMNLYRLFLKVLIVVWVFGLLK